LRFEYGISVESSENPNEDNSIDDTKSCKIDIGSKRIEVKFCSFDISVQMRMNFLYDG